MVRYQYTEKIRRLNDEKNVRKLLRMVDFPVLEPDFFEKHIYEIRIDGLDFKLTYVPGQTGMISTRTPQEYLEIKRLVLDCIC